VRVYRLCCLVQTLFVICKGTWCSLKLAADPAGTLFGVCGRQGDSLIVHLVPVLDCL
jgi:hypothetical protein